ncbi:MobA/MobL family protein [Aminobacter sp. AP02]|uniref:MobA/MobL family protein n=1 Tax=Aminobacter sp. AP02 TaxID=2135737 RepID=UPI000D6C4B5B|nr:MobA/MobL family protein [Aminobacter sp. AP02]PWK64640.1 MobA/MobL family protein [Aminobacter sp. AP02]
MTTSLPPDSAIFNFRVSLFQRSAGRSAVAAAAYRSASRLEDRRIGQVFDYRKKSAEDSFILAPSDAPGWAYDRNELWNRVEQAERRRDAVVAREILVTIPRDILEEDRRAFIEEAVKPYLAAGAIIDISYHRPRAADREEQPHFHVMLSTRRLDASAEHGFAHVRNAELAAMFESGGRHGGERGDALKAERERMASLMNAFLTRAGSPRRADHRSNAARGLHDREPEPTMGEGRKKAVTRRRTHDRCTALVSSMRASRIAENELINVEEEIMSVNATRQTRGGIRPRSKQGFKEKLFRERFPDLSHSAGWVEEFHFIDTATPGVTQIATKDGGHVEIRGRIAKVFGARGVADAFVAELDGMMEIDAIERLEELKSLQRKGSGLRQRRRTKEVPHLPADHVGSLADRWRSRGYHKITESPDGVWITIGACRLQDLGDELRIHGPAASDAACRAMVEKAAAEWAGEVEVFGDRAFKDSCWLEAQRQGVTIYDQATGAPYQPCDDLRRKFEADQTRLRGKAEEIDELKRHKTVASLLLEAAASDVAALTKLEANDSDLVDFVTLHLDDEQRGKLVSKSHAEVIAALPAFRDYGRKAREVQAERFRTRAFEAPLDFDPTRNDTPTLRERLALAITEEIGLGEPKAADFTRRPQ